MHLLFVLGAVFLFKTRSKFHYDINELYIYCNLCFLCCKYILPSRYFYWEISEQNTYESIVKHIFNQ